MKLLQRPEWASKVVEQMKAKKITQDVLCRALGVSLAATSHYLTGRRDPTLAQLAIIANVLNLSPAELVYDIRQQASPIPLLAWTDITRTGNTKKAPLSITTQEIIPYFYGNKPEIYALRVQDDAMFSPLSLAQSFRENTIIIVDPTQTPHENQFVIAVYKKNRQPKEVIFRQYVKVQGHYYLKPINQQYPMTRVNQTIELKGCIIGQITTYD